MVPPPPSPPLGFSSPLAPWVPPPLFSPLRVLLVLLPSSPPPFGLPPLPPVPIRSLSLLALSSRLGVFVLAVWPPPRALRLRVARPRCNAVHVHVNARLSRHLPNWILGAGDFVVQRSIYIYQLLSCATSYVPNMVNTLNYITCPAFPPTILGEFPFCRLMSTGSSRQHPATSCLHASWPRRT